MTTLETVMLKIELFAAAMTMNPASLDVHGRREELRRWIETLIDAAGELHASDCAVHNMPAYPNGPCDCGATKTYTGTGPVPWKCVDDSECKHGWWCSETYCQDKCQFRNDLASGAAPKQSALQLLEMSQDNYVSQFGSDAASNWIYDDLRDLFSDEQKETDRGTN